MTTSKVRTAVVAAAITTVCAGFLINRLLEDNRPKDVVASSLLECAQAGDPSCLMARMTSEEIEKGGWSKRAVSTFLRDEIVPFWQNKKAIGAKEIGNLTFQGQAVQMYELSNYVKMPQGIVTQSTIKGKKHLFCFSDLVRQLWSAQYCEKFGIMQNKVDSWKGYLWGLEKDEIKLIKLGVTGLCRLDLDTGLAKVVPLSEVKDQLRELIAHPPKLGPYVNYGTTKIH
jgi:hypothetical protein